MIISAAFGRLFDGVTVTIIDNGVEVSGKQIKYWYGDREELNAWIIDQNKKATPDKYPLVWYLKNSYTEFQGWYTADVTFVIMTTTRLEKMNDWRNSVNYEGVLQPVWKAIEPLLNAGNYIEVFGNLENRFTQYDDPNFGIKPIDQNLKGSSENKSVSIDIVDCKVINFKMRMYADCVKSINFNKN